MRRMVCDQPLTSCVVLFAKVISSPSLMDFKKALIAITVYVGYGE